MNFQSAAANVTLDLSGVAAGGLTNLRTSAAVPLQTKLSVDVPAYGYELFLVFERTLRRSQLRQQWPRFSAAMEWPD